MTQAVPGLAYTRWLLRSLAVRGEEHSASRAQCGAGEWVTTRSKVLRSSDTR